MDERVVPRPLQWPGRPTAGAAPGRIRAALPTAAAGLAGWRVTGGGTGRVGVVHASVNTTALLLYGSSWVARRRSANQSAVALGVAADSLPPMGGYLGGHLSLVRKIGTTDAAFGPDGEAPPA